MWICRLHQQAFDSLYTSFCLPVCLWIVRTACCVLHVIASHELNKYSRSILTSIVCDHLSGIPYQEIRLLVEEMTSLAVRLSSLSMSGHFEKQSAMIRLWWLVSSKRSAPTFTQGRSGMSIRTSSSFGFALECSSHTRQAATVSSLCADIPGQSKTRLALPLHLTIPR